MPKFEHFGPKSINFPILTKFCLNPILTMLISNLIFVFENLTPNMKIPKYGHFGSKVSTKVFYIYLNSRLGISVITFEQIFADVG